MKTRGFTLIELVLALGASAITLAAVYGLFSRAIHLRNDATERTRVARMRTHAMSVLRNDLTHALISGGTLASVLEGSKQGAGNFPGYLKFITTTQRDPGDDQSIPSNELQQVEYFVVADPAGADARSGMLIRATDGNLLAQTRIDPPEEKLLSGIESIEVDFYDGNSWQDQWKYAGTDNSANSNSSTGSTTATTTTTTSGSTTLPRAIRVRIQPAGSGLGQLKPAPLEVLVPWGTQPAIVQSTTTATTTP